MMVTAAIRSRPRPQRFWIKWPAPGISHPIAGATIGIIPPAATGRALSFVLATAIGLPKLRATNCGLRLSDDDEFFLYSPRHFRRRLADQHIHLAAHAEFRQVNARFHREAGIGKQFAD